MSFWETLETNRQVGSGFFLISNHGITSSWLEIRGKNLTVQQY